MIRENVQRLLHELPEGVTLLAAVKERSADEISQAIEAGVTVIGENYLQESLQVINEVKGEAQWHFIGHLQTNKVKRVVDIFDMIESVDSLKLAKEIARCSKRRDRIMSVLIEVNSGEENQKNGVAPRDVEQLIREISSLDYIKIMGLMTMGPRFGDAEESRPYFRKTRELFEKFKDFHLPNVEMKYLSMGMTNSYKVAIEEGANLVRIGTKIFGEREGSHN
ncbi:MAG: YggS family pyridoxal phosphate-dependent enzyme [Deltaproteobacteria bacterium]|nr:MAG: YggS family pyridoxal phosphate-dependent enzyme [Deltaproteobacteria bacterium]